MNIVAIIIFVFLALNALPVPRRGKYTRRRRKHAYRNPRASRSYYRPVPGIYNTCKKLR